MSNNAPSLQLYRIGAAACLCLFLSGCPTASNPTQPQTPPPSPPPQTSSSSNAAGSTSSPSQPSQPSSAAESEGSSQSDDNQSTAASSDAMGPPEDDAQTSGDSSDQTAQSAAEVDSDSGDSMEPGFGDGITSGDNLPDLRDEPIRSTAQGTTSEADGTAADVGASENVGQSNGETAGSGSPDGYNGSSRYSIPTGMPGDSGSYDSPTGMPAGGSGPLTPAEQVAILDAQLEKGVGEFDAIIMDSQAEQREVARTQASRRSPVPIASISDANAGQDNITYDDDIVDAGGYSGGGGIPDEYETPDDIPNGSGDSLAARQLRELAVREPDPAIRARLWDEYRKLKGIKN